MKHYVICGNDCLVESMTKEEIIALVQSATGYTPTGDETAVISKIINQNNGSSISFWVGTRVEYNALTEKDANTIYHITDDKTGNEAYQVASEAKRIAEEARERAYGTMSVKPVWTNENPTEEFRAGTVVECYLTGADFVMVEFKSNKSSNNTTVAICRVGTNGIGICGNASRVFTTTENSVEFDIGKIESSSSAAGFTQTPTAMIPTKIYGVYASSATGTNSGSSEGSGITSTMSNSLWAILQKTAFTQALTDNEINAFKTAWGINRTVKPDTPDAITLTSISAVYTGGDVVTGTAVTELTGITVTATYSDGTTQTVTGYTLSGDIVEGENTITVSYSGKTTTFTVTGIVESGGETTAELITDGLLAFFDFRNNPFVSNVAGTTAYGSVATQGSGHLVAWGNPATTADDKGLILENSRKSNYAQSGTTTLDLDTEFSVFVSFYTGSASKSYGLKDFFKDSNSLNINLYAPYYDSSNATKSVSLDGKANINLGYNVIGIVANGNILKYYCNGECVYTADSSNYDDFEKWLSEPPISSEVTTAQYGLQGTTATIYNKALTDIEVTELTAYLKTLEVA